MVRYSQKLSDNSDTYCIDAKDVHLVDGKLIGEPIDRLAQLEELHTAKQPNEYEDKYYGCPTCGNVLMHKWKHYPTELMPKEMGLPRCICCGQEIDWSDYEG